MKITTVNPATEVEIHSYDVFEPAKVHEIVNHVDGAFAVWSAMPIKERMMCMTRAGKHLRANSRRYAEMISREMGKPVKQGLAEIEKCAWCCDVYAEKTEAWLKDDIISADGVEHRIVYQPLGVILAVMPWNFPFWQVFRCAVPVMCAGNTIVLKHASNVTGCAFCCEEVFTAAGFPENAFRTVLADYAAVSELLSGTVVKGLSMTGSSSAGRRLGEIAGRNMKKMVLELGGSDPFIVLPDADMNVAAAAAVTGRFQNCGQSCIAAKRFIVHESIVNGFSNLLGQCAAALTLGDPLGESTEIGPLVHEAALKEIEEQVEDAITLGATIITGGERFGEKGFFYKPTVICDVTRDMKIFKEEVFGPVAAIMSFKDADEAIALANETDFGLSGSVWTKDIEKGKEVALRIDAGTVFVNGVTKSDPRMPFGGIKMSGVGRELAWFGLKEFTNIKGLNVYRHGF